MTRTKEEMQSALDLAVMEINIRFAPKKYYGPMAPWKFPESPKDYSGFASKSLGPGDFGFRREYKKWV